MDRVGEIATRPGPMAAVPVRDRSAQVWPPGEQSASLAGELSCKCIDFLNDCAGRSGADAAELIQEIQRLRPRLEPLGAVGARRHGHAKRHGVPLDLVDAAERLVSSVDPARIPGQSHPRTKNHKAWATDR